MPPKFGTSGLRGLVNDLTPELIGAHVTAFVKTCPVGTGLFVGRDLRPSSPDITGLVIAAARLAGVSVTDCGDTPTPALALAAMSAGAAAVMVTGSHIPADRNGLKFYTPAGEITKDDETAILDALGKPVAARDAPLTAYDAGPDYVARYLTAFGLQALHGLTIGAYTHSTVGRDMMMAILSGLGANVVELGRADHFIPVDTEAVDPQTRQQLRDWAGAQALDAIVSMDGDGDRPLLTDSTGEVVPGDILGQITARALGSDVVVTPVSSNSGVLQCGFDKVIQTRIGSPYVIAGMAQAGGRVSGYEANGGYLLGHAANGPEGPLSPLMTRDSMLPMVTVLHASRDHGIAALVARNPARFTAADRLQDVATQTSQALVAALRDDATPLLSPLGGTLSVRDETDGLRLTLSDGRIVHLRPSGNAPELRFYVEASSPEIAQSTLSQGLSILAGLAA